MVKHGIIGGAIVAQCALIPLATCFLSGCLSVKTEHEIKPIQITMDVNLKVQKELEDFLNLD